ncbi:hypothetical protein GCM10009809_11170 [Isoptericola hypogeus]|uniref:Uncharacterized protein n=1 Tax=Isoptericola hypogeus TaxID=300179 RepID=A0ABP4V2Z8_9MICO
MLRPGNTTRAAALRDEHRAQGGRDDLRAWPPAVLSRRRSAWWYFPSLKGHQVLRRPGHTVRGVLARNLTDGARSWSAVPARHRRNGQAALRVLAVRFPVTVIPGHRHDVPGKPACRHAS